MPSRGSRGPVDIAFSVAFGLIAALQLGSWLTSCAAVDEAASVGRILVLPLAMLLLGVAVVRARSGSEDPGERASAD